MNIEMKTWKIFHLSVVQPFLYRLESIRDRRTLPEQQKYTHSLEVIKVSTNHARTTARGQDLFIYLLIYNNISEIKIYNIVLIANGRQ